MSKKRAENVSIKELIAAMQEVIEEGNEDVKTNVLTLADKLGLTELTVKTRIRQAKFEYPQFRLLDLSRFVATPGKRKETVPEDELTEFMAKVLNKPVKEVEAKVEEKRKEINEELKEKKERKSRETASTAS